MLLICHRVSQTYWTCWTTLQRDWYQPKQKNFQRKQVTALTISYLLTLYLNSCVGRFSSTILEYFNFCVVFFSSICLIYYSVLTELSFLCFINWTVQAMSFCQQNEIKNDHKLQWRLPFHRLKSWENWVLMDRLISIVVSKAVLQTLDLWYYFYLYRQNPPQSKYNFNSCRHS